MSTLLHVIMPDSKGLFHRAAADSPGPWKYFEQSDLARYSRLFSTARGCIRLRASDRLACMRALPADELYGAGGLDVAGLPMIFQPAMGDGGGQLEDQPLSLLSKGQFDTSVEVLVGHNQYEGESTRHERSFTMPSQPTYCVLRR